MNIGSLGTSNVTLGASPVSSGLQKLQDGAASAPTDEARRAQEDHAATQFESVFLSMIIKEMRATLSEGLFGKEGSDTFGALFDLHMGEHLAERGGLGVREMVAATYRDNSVPSRSGPEVDRTHSAADLNEVPSVSAE